MPSNVINPALSAFIDQLPLVFGQVSVRAVEGRYELRHSQDESKPASELAAITLADVRKLAQFTEAGQFRPLKSAPTLRSGWLLTLPSAETLEEALNQLYPGALADWFWVKQAAGPVISLREFTKRQTGMYRITAMLSDEVASQVTKACCHVRFCLKQRLWQAPVIPVDQTSEKSQIPCLEPCAIFMEFARKGMRIEQEDRKTPLSVGPSDAATLQAALNAALNNPATGGVEGNLSDPLNPRRVQLFLEKFGKVLDSMNDSGPKTSEP